VELSGSTLAVSCNSTSTFGDECSGLAKNPLPLKASPAWVWVDVGMAWAMAPLAGGNLQLSLWGSIVPSWLSITVALGYGLCAEEVALNRIETAAPLGLLAMVVVCGLCPLAIGYQVMWEHAKDRITMMDLADEIVETDKRGRHARFSELLLRHLVTEPALHVLAAGVKELFNDAKTFVIHSDALQQIKDGIDTFADHGETALGRLRSGAPDLPPPAFELADMEAILDACLHTTAYLAVSRDHHAVQLDLKVSPHVAKMVKTFRLWLSQMTRACLIHSLHPEEKSTVTLRVHYARPGLLRVGVEAIWRVRATGKGGKGLASRQRLTGWDNEMPEAAWWVRAAALSLGGEADYSFSTHTPGFHELWFTLPAENVSDESKREFGEREADEISVSEQLSLPRPEQRSPGQQTADSDAPLQTDDESEDLKDASSFSNDISMSSAKPGGGRGRIGVVRYGLPRPGAVVVASSRKRSLSALSKRRPKAQPQESFARSATRIAKKRSRVGADVARQPRRVHDRSRSSSAPPPRNRAARTGEGGGARERVRRHSAKDPGGTGRASDGSEIDSSDISDLSAPNLKILFVDPEGLLRWVLPRL
ncbi:unnamed protein product, partial [Ascophyllum nodosum]